MSIQRFYQLTVSNKHEFNAGYFLNFSYTLNNPPWLRSALDDNHLALEVTEIEFNSTKIGDVFTVQITS